MDFRRPASIDGTVISSAGCTKCGARIPGEIDTGRPRPERWHRLCDDCSDALDQWIGERDGSSEENDTP